MAAKSTPSTENEARMTLVGLIVAVRIHIRYTLGRLPALAGTHSYYMALALAVRDRMPRLTLGEHNANLSRPRPQGGVLPLGRVFIFIFISLFRNHCASFG